MRPAFWQPVTLLVAAAALAGCADSPDRDPRDRSPARDAAFDSGTASEDTLTIHYQADERIFGPFWDVEARFVIFQPLVTRDREGRFAPALARRWEHSEDYRRWTFHLHPDARWHDGEPFTARDVEFTLELCSHPDVLYEDQWHGLDSLVVRDDSTITYFYERPTDARDTWNVFFPRHLLEELDPAEFFSWDFWLEPVGYGPYRYVRHEPKTMVEVEANPDYYGGEPPVDRILIRFGGASPLVELRSGAVDVVPWLNRAQVPLLRGDERFRIYHHVEPPVYWFRALFWNHRHPALSDRRVRRALTLALDRRTLMAALNLPEGLPLVDGFFSARQYAEDHLPPALPHDMDRAGALLDEAGWRAMGRDGMRERDGRPLRIDLLVGAGDIGEEAAILIQDAWARVGVDVRIVSLEPRIMRNRQREGRFDAAIAPYFHAPPGHLKELGAEGTIGYDDPELTRLLRDLVATVAPDARDSLYREISDRIRRDLPVTLLFPVATTSAAHRRVRGLESPHRGNPFWHPEELWIQGGS